MITIIVWKLSPAAHQMVVITIMYHHLTEYKITGKLVKIKINI